MSENLALQQTEWDLHDNPETVIPLAFTEEIKPELFGLEVAKATEMVSGLSTSLSEREVLKNEYADVIDFEITTETLPIFKELRLKIVKNRTHGIEKWHKTNKAFYLAGGRFVDAVKNKEIIINEEMEAKLLAAEKFFENLEKAKVKELNDARIERIRPFVDDVTGLDFAPMSDEDFDDYVLGKKTKFENAQKEAEAEALRIETERLAEIERQKAVEAENAKLKSEAEAKAKELEKERSKAKAEADKVEAENQAKLKIERDAKAKIEAELQVKKDAEIKTENERFEKEKAEKLASEKLAKAGVKVQLDTWIGDFNIEIPIHLKDNEIANEIISKFWKFKSWAKKQNDL